MVFVMESNETDYRLERWLAIILSLLFFLPFVARADEIVFATESYHGEEMPFRDGEEFLALKPDAVLAPMRISVTPETGMFDKKVSVIGYEEIYLIRGKNLHPGKVGVAEPDFSPLMPERMNATFTLGPVPYDLSYRCSANECTLELDHGDATQDLVTAPRDAEHYIVFAGDLDHDGKLDLIANLARHWNEWRPVLLLSSAAKNGEIVGLAAELSTTGC